MSDETTDTSADDDTPRPEYTIDELAALTKVPSRTIRFYQSKKALPPPRLKGRVAYYDARHVERLKLIATLQDRGLRISAIRDLVARLEKGEVSLGDWLGLDDQLKSPWMQDQPRLLTEQELKALAVGSDGSSADARPGLIADLLRLKLVTREGDGYLARSAGLLRVGLELERAGVDLEVASEASELMRKSLSRLSDDLATFFVRHAGKGFGGDGSPEALGKSLQALRPLGLEAMQLIFSMEMERALRQVVETGQTTQITRRRRRKR